MKIVLTKHVKDRMKTRGITIFDLRDILVSARPEFVDGELIKLHAWHRDKKIILVIKKQQTILTIITIFWRK